jgi:hypothetical protein
MPTEIDTIKLSTEPILPVNVTVIGTGDGGTPLRTGTTGVTPDHQPNLAVNVISPVVAIGVRFINTFLTTLLGILTGALATNVITASDFAHLIYKCAGLAVAGSVIGLIKDTVTIFSRLEQRFPLGSGSV